MRNCIAAILIGLGAVSCSDGNEDGVLDEAAENDDVLADALQVQVAGWTDFIEVSYIFTNATDSDVVVFDASQAGQNLANAALLEDETVRLLRGKYELFGVTSVTAPLIDGRLVVPGGAVQGTAIRGFPLPHRQVQKINWLRLFRQPASSSALGFPRLTTYWGQRVAMAVMGWKQVWSFNALPVK